jgi:precorrin-6A/cobalt-precorrin-6A reductase
MKAKVLILGGTRDARLLASLLVATGLDVTTSLAGVTAAPILPEGQVRLGSFGGARGLLAYITRECFDALADATHPFAAQISRHGFAAASRASIPYFRLERPAWTPGEGDDWDIVSSPVTAAAALPHAARALITTGRKGLEAFIARADLSGLIRTIEPPPIPFSARWTLIQERPPFALADEIKLMRENSITHLLAKNSGGPATEAKLRAARQLGIKVVMIARPSKPGDEIHATAEEVSSALARRFGLDP